MFILCIDFQSYHRSRNKATPKFPFDFSIIFFLIQVGTILVLVAAVKIRGVRKTPTKISKQEETPFF
jgi:hypothetical protein